MDDNGDPYTTVECQGAREVNEPEFEGEGAKEARSVSMKKTVPLLDYGQNHGDVANISIS